jgi:hypothetical protein
MPSRQPTARYQVICYEIIGEQRNLIMDSTDQGFIAATGSIKGGGSDGELSHAGPRDLQAQLALMIANDDQLLGKHRSKALNQYERRYRLQLMCRSLLRQRGLLFSRCAL